MDQQTGSVARDLLGVVNRPENVVWISLDQYNRILQELEALAGRYESQSIRKLYGVLKTLAAEQGIKINSFTEEQ